MNVVQIIEAKRNGQQLDEKQIEFLIKGYAIGTVPDYQMSAFAMAVYFQGMEFDETVALTRAIIHSGERMKWSGGKPKVDKHSTGGIGDKVSIPLAPMLACCGVDVPMVSGRGLGSTGGTLDKLESIPGFRCNLSMDEFRSVVNWTGCAIVSASEQLAPADRKLYALRDVTATVPSIPLICSSILSKKISEGIDALILDVKWGSGAFMKTLDQARDLAETLVRVANELGVKTTAIVSDMNQPLGVMIGNAVEIDESIKILQGSGPDDLRDLTLTLGARLLLSAKVENDMKSAHSRLVQTIESGEAMKKFDEMVRAQNGSLDTPRALAKSHVVAAYDEGFVSRVDSDRLGLAVIEMGGGRKQIGESIDHSVGIEFLVRIGDKIEKGQPVANLFCHDETAEYANNLVSLSIGTSPFPVEQPKLVAEVIE